jgi:hypothetical protein
LGSPLNLALGCRERLMLKAMFKALAAIGIASGSAAVAASELDEQMVEVAAFFSGKIQGDNDVLFASQLDRSKLDLSVESVRVVDSWLNVLLAHKVDPGSKEAAETLVWAGGYVGEVIRACAKRKYTWKRYEEYMPGQPEAIQKLFPRTFGTQFLLVADPQGMTLPLNKVVRFLAEGPENNLHYYVSGECKR